MDFESLLNELEIEELEELSYFEGFCTLMEFDGTISEEVFFDLLMGIEPEALGDLMNSYLEEIMVGVPDDAIDLYTLLSSYRRSINRFLTLMEQEDSWGSVLEEIYRFRKWYAEEKQVPSVDLETGKANILTLCAALIFGRLERLAEGKYQYDFTNCLDFEYEDFDNETDEILGNDEYYDQDDDQDDEMDNTLIDKENPVIDSEDYEKEEGEEWQ